MMGKAQNVKYTTTFRIDQLFITFPMDQHWFVLLLIISILQELGVTKKGSLFHDFKVHLVIESTIFTVLFVNVCWSNVVVGHPSGNQVPYVWSGSGPMVQHHCHGIVTHHNQGWHIGFPIYRILVNISIFFHIPDIVLDRNCTLENIRYRQI